MRKFILACAAVAAAVAFSPVVNAQPVPKVAEPASLLVFPLFDSRPASATIINVTNLNTDRTVCPDNDNLRVGDVRLHYVYNGATQEELDGEGRVRWREFDRVEDLTPGDTITVLASQHNPEGEMGYLTIQAVSPDFFDAIEFEYLIGSAYVANSDLDILWCYLPFSFEADATGDADACGHTMLSQTFPIVYGDEYAFLPEILYVDSFFEERAGVFDNKVTLMSTAGADYITEVDVLIWNNKEDRFSRTLKFNCWTSLPLSAISAAAANLNGDPDEFVAETGWARFRGRRVLDLAGRPQNSVVPGLLGVFMQAVRVDFISGHEMQMTGELSTVQP